VLCYPTAAFPQAPLSPAPDCYRFRLPSSFSRHHYCHASSRFHCCCLSCGESILSTCLHHAIGGQHRHSRPEIPFVALKLIYCHYFSILIIFYLESYQGLLLMHFGILASLTQRQPQPLSLWLYSFCSQLQNLFFVKYTFY